MDERVSRTSENKKKNGIENGQTLGKNSDFVSAAKHARREGIDFVLDPMGSSISPDLNEHVDGIRTMIKKFRQSDNQ